MIATRRTNFPVKKGDKLAGTRVIPLVIEKEKMEEAKKAAGSEPLLKLIPYKNKKAGIVTTGNEVFYGRIEDKFGPVIRDKLQEFGVEVLGQKIIGDNPDKITEAIREWLDQGADFVVCTGGMSVDPMIRHRARSSRPGRRLSPTARRYSRERCSCWHIRRTESRSWDFRAA